jgi:hypothetical protein
VHGPAGYGQLKGLQRYFSPPEAAAFGHRAICGGEAASDYTPFVLDPTAGNGALVACERRLRVCSDPARSRRATTPPCGATCVAGEGRIGPGPPLIPQLMPFAYCSRA